MTTDLEKQFFSTFGIEPKYEDACTVEDKYWNNEELANEYGTFDQYMNCKCGNQENCTTECSCAYQKEIYPQITDRILLELICLCPDMDDVFFIDVERLKETLLNSYINIYNYYINVDLLSDCGKELKHRVRTLFEEG